jgi:NAD(P)-dependent dehydrogenase (short-subunit alcohol dehydrogenase family)
MHTLKGRTCVFAGATGAIGHGAVEALAKEGMNVIMVTHNPESAGNIVSEMKGYPGQVVAMSNEASNKEVFEKVMHVFGSLDVVITTTGGLLAVAKPEDISDELLDEKMHHQVTEAYNMVRAALPYLEKSPHGRIILTANGGAIDGFSGENIADSIARGGVISMTYTLARALGGRGITVNCIARSGMIDDHTPKAASDFAVASIADRIPVRHIGRADEFGAIVEYIASEEADFVTGHIFNLTGGLHIG